MDEAERRAQIRSYWQYTGSDQGQDITHEIYHDDAILEFPQSGERFEGVANFKEWRSQYPAGVTLEMRNLRGQGDLWVVEGSISYDDGPWQPAVNILEFRGDKVARRRSTSPNRGTPRSGVPSGGRRRSTECQPVFPPFINVTTVCPQSLLIGGAVFETESPPPQPGTTDPDPSPEPGAPEPGGTTTETPRRSPRAASSRQARAVR